ncbi:MAG: C-terminal processing protease CtpA/Prc [Colwellia sp.]|jgi:C-terminal processing protease CtpA/Prc
MADIADDTLKNDNQVKVAVIANVAPLEVDTDFGIVLDDDNTRIKLLAVLPNSLADALGLVSSDIIIAMGGKPVDLKGTSAEDIVLSYLYSVKHNDALTMVVKRNDESIQLSHQYLPLAFPEASYQIYNQRKEGKVLIKKGC